MMSREQYLLIKLAEEASEIAQIALKTSQFGMEEKYHKLDTNNKERIHAELNDLLGVVDLLNGESGFGFTQDSVASCTKAEKINKYYKLSQELGMVKEI